MAAPITAAEFLDLVRKSEVVESKRLDSYLQKQEAAGPLPTEASPMAGLLVRDSVITQFQAEALLQGKWKRFSIGKYKVLERIGSGGMGQVYLCEHKLMRRRVAVKVLPTAQANDPEVLQRFYREARAAAALDHPNIVHAYDIDQDGNLHFLVMEYIDGASLYDLVKKSGPLDITRAAHYIRQAAQGLQHAHDAGLVHRDIKPSNILVDRAGTVKVLDMGLARFFNDEEDILTKKMNNDVLGTADYLAPEQTMDSHGVDIRADIYSLGATFYYLLTGRTLFGEGTIAQKLLWHQNRTPEPIQSLRPDVSAELAAVVDKMLTKDRGARYQTPAEVLEALAPWTQTAIAAPSSTEMPALPPGVVEPSAVSSGSAAWPRSFAQGVGSSHELAVAQAQQAALAEKSAEWQGIAEEESAEVEAPIARRPAARTRTAPPERGRNWLVLGLIAFVAVGGLSTAIIVLSTKTPSSAPPPVKKGLEVSRDPSRNGYRTIREAIKAARAGETVELWDEVIHEHVLVDSSLPSVTIKAAPGRSVVWKGKNDEPVLIVSGAKKFVLDGKGITLDGTLDGKRWVRDLVRLQLMCPGVIIQDVHLKNYARSGVFLANCAGDEKNPVRVTGLVSDEPEKVKPQAGILFEANNTVSPPRNNHIIIGPCEFRGFPSLDAAIKRRPEVLGPNVTFP